MIGGTGKSQVIKSLNYFFEQRNEAHHMVILGPTGTSAALLGGSTYHSYLGINGNRKTSNKALATIIAQIQSKLEGVDYIFIDEVSIMFC